jgi:lysophospholipase L1-like esterase
MAFGVKPRQTVLFVGDSITDCGRRDTFAPLGEGYVRMVNDLVAARYPGHRLNVINVGIGGNTVRDLADRWSDDVIRHKPDWLSVKIGINDMAQWVAQEPTRSVSPEQHLELYDHILARATKETRAKIVLVDPFYISRDRDPVSQRGTRLKQLPKYIAVVHAMSRKYRTRLVKTHDAFQAQLKYYPPDRFCPEPIHPFASGYLVIAHAWLKTMGW